MREATDWMGTFYEVGEAARLPQGSMQEVMVEGKAILIARVGDRYYAADNRCPHLGGSLAQGTLDGTVVTCPRHGSQFDLSDGRAIRWLRDSGLVSRIGRAIKSPRPIAVYNVKVEDGKIMVEI